jgi:magnesium-transporting ATPase (P-type)
MQVICVDKTGTLTTNAMVVSRAAIPSQRSNLWEFSVSTHIPAPTPGSARATAVPSIVDVASGAAVERPADIEGLRVVATIGAVCNDATLSHDLSTGKFSHVGESMEGALCVFAERVGQPSQILESAAVRFIPLRPPWTSCRA